MEMRSDLKAESGDDVEHLCAKIFSQLALCFGSTGISMAWLAPVLALFLLLSLVVRPRSA